MTLKVTLKTNQKNMTYKVTLKGNQNFRVTERKREKFAENASTDGSGFWSRKVSNTLNLT